jgi:hypothetical protein
MTMRHFAQAKKRPPGGGLSIRAKRGWITSCRHTNPLLRVCAFSMMGRHDYIMPPNKPAVAGLCIQHDGQA